ncbi:MAG: peptidoglycan-binding protein [Actinomycetota bacterium]|nr:peptidoglycan-binding protein [Actinomycetota bacterium]
MLVLYRGAGSNGVDGSAPVRALQRRLVKAGYSPGPADGRFGPRTEQAVLHFQAARGLLVDGVAGAQTLRTLTIQARRQHHGSGLHAARKLRATTKRNGTPARRRSGSTATRVRRRGRSTSSLSVGWLVLIGVLGLLGLLSGARRSRRRRSIPTATVFDETGARTQAEQSGDAEGAFSLGVRLEQQGDRDGALAAYERADQLGHSAAACNLGVLLEEQGRLPAAEAAYQRAQQHGDGTGAFNLGVLLEQRGFAEGATRAYRKADKLGHLGAACNLGVLLETQGDFAGAEAAYRRADKNGDANGTFNLGAVLGRQGDVGGALAAFGRAEQVGGPEVCEVARSAAHELRVAVGSLAGRQNGGDQDGA